MTILPRVNPLRGVCESLGRFGRNLGGRVFLLEAGGLDSSQSQGPDFRRLYPVFSGYGGGAARAFLFPLFSFMPSLDFPSESDFCHGFFKHRRLGSSEGFYGRRSEEPGQPVQI